MGQLFFLSTGLTNFHKLYGTVGQGQFNWLYSFRTTLFYCSRRLHSQEQRGCGYERYPGADQEGGRSTVLIPDPSEKQRRREDRYTIGKIVESERGASL